mmetsp:Transcript_37967/g.70078  ORF Transcript_37967/g.70078 Transcript_37967/m.70078 type:complete len:81 (+) Transcript_37967:152-394(+)
MIVTCAAGPSDGSLVRLELAVKSRGRDSDTCSDTGSGIGDNTCLFEMTMAGDVLVIIDRSRTIIACLAESSVQCTLWSFY